MDPSVLNTKNRAPSIVKKAPVTRHDSTPISNCPKWLKEHKSRPETRHNRDVSVTQTYLYTPFTDIWLWEPLPGALSQVRPTLRGGRRQPGGDD